MGKQQCLLLWLCMGNKWGNNSAYYYGYVWVTNSETTNTTNYYGYVWVKTETQQTQPIINQAMYG